MTYHTPHRIAVLSFIKEGGSKAEASRTFNISRDTIYRWLKMENVAPQPPPKTRHRKIDKVALVSHVKENPDMLLRERAALFGVKASSMSYALRKLGISKKNSVDTKRVVL